MLQQKQVDVSEKDLQRGGGEEEEEQGKVGHVPVEGSPNIVRRSRHVRSEVFDALYYRWFAILSLSLFCLLFAVGFMLIYIIAPLQRYFPGGPHIMVWPDIYISSALSIPPAAGLGTFFFSLSCFFLACTVFVRVREVQNETRAPPQRHARVHTCIDTPLHLLAILTATLSIMGFLGVLSFRAVEHKTAHTVFADIAFISFPLFLLIQDIFDWMHPELASMAIRIVRTLATCAVIIAFLMWALVSSVGLASVCELVGFGLLAMYFLTYLPTFWRMRMNGSEVGLEEREKDKEGKEWEDVKRSEGRKEERGEERKEEREEEERKEVRGEEREMKGEEKERKEEEGGGAPPKEAAVSRRNIDIEVLSGAALQEAVREVKAERQGSRAA